MIHQVCCSIWRSQWHFNLYFHWLYSYIQQSYHTYTQIPFQVAVRFGSCPAHCHLSDRCLSVCQTFAPNYRNRLSLISYCRIMDRPTPDVSAVRLSASVFKPLILSNQDSVLNLPSSLIMEILNSPHHSFTGLKSRTILNCLTKSNCLTYRTIHTYFAHDNWSMCALRPEYKP